MSLQTNLIRALPASLPPGFCPKSWQEANAAIMGGARFIVLLDTGSFIYNFGNVTPAPENRVFPWLNTDDGLWWEFRFGLWTSPMDPSDREPTFRKIWKPAAGTPESALWSLDSGDGSDPSIIAPTATTGASWQVDHDLDGRTFFGIGTVPGTTTPAVTIAAGQSGGAGEQTLDNTQLPDLDVTIPVKAAQADGLDSDTSEVLCNPNTSFNALDLHTTTGGGGKPHPIMPPWFAGYWIKPTARIYRTRPA